MDGASRFSFRFDAQEIADLERATGLLITDEESWSAQDYDTVIAYLRRKALATPTFRLGPTGPLPR
jgi:hypothetical protein